jgi:hypothetical protein
MPARVYKLTFLLVIHPDGTLTLAGKGMQFGTLGTCGTGSRILGDQR